MTRTVILAALIALLGSASYAKDGERLKPFTQLCIADKSKMKSLGEFYYEVIRVLYQLDT